MKHFGNNQEKFELVLEIDGTNIVDDSQFMLLKKNTKIMVIKPAEEWPAKQLEDRGKNNVEQHRDVQRQYFFMCPRAPCGARESL